MAISQMFKRDFALLILMETWILKRELALSLLFTGLYFSSKAPLLIRIFKSVAR